MIEELRIRSLGVIDEATIPLGSGLTVLTGETGAGKTMVLTGLSLILGARADSGIVRTGAERADADGLWLLPEDAPVLPAVEELGGSVDEAADGRVQLALGRSVGGAGRSRAFVGGRTVPASSLADIAASLVTVHGQSDQLRLRDRASQRDLLDRFAGPAHLSRREAFGEALVELRALERERDQRIGQRQDREREAALLRHGIDEIAAVEPQTGEDAALKQQAAMLAHATDLLAAMGGAHAALAGGEADGPSVADLLAQVQRDLERAAAVDDRVGPLAKAVEELAGRAGDLAAEVARYATALDADPARQAEVEERRHRISELKRRYGPELDDVLDWWQAAERTVQEVDGTEERLADLHRRIEALTAQVRTQAAALTKGRRAAARDLAERVTAELHDLAMPDAVVTIDVETAADVADLTATGADTVTMLLAPHPGSDARPLGAGASGGELSRVMLAIEVVLADVDGTPTFVFDEVDAGIGGRVAVEVGRRLSRLARSAQVVVVTHLPQVAAFADAHIVVSKDSSGQVTASSVVPVDGPDRVRELVRMLSGLEGSESGAQHASELLQLAEAERTAR